MEWYFGLAFVALGIITIALLLWQHDDYQRKLALKNREILNLKDDLLRLKAKLPRYARDIDWQD
jgi:hypothetical protein